jgi:ribonuclease G
VLNRFRTEDSKILMELERSHNGRLIFRADAGMHRERFAIIDPSTDKSIVQI